MYIQGRHGPGRPLRRGRSRRLRGATGAGSGPGGAHSGYSGFDSGTPDRRKSDYPEVGLAGLFWRGVGLGVRPSPEGLKCGR